MEVEPEAAVVQPEEPALAVGSVGELFAERYAPMVRLAFLLTGSNEVAEDLVQDCFARLHRKARRIDVPAAYLRTMVVNACRSWHRSRAREQRRLRVVHDDTPAALDADEMLDAVARLPYPQRAALVMRYYEHASEQEIAAALSCPVNTVKSHLRRGLAALRLVVQP